MRASLAAAMFYIAILLLSAGLVLLIIHVLGAHFGAMNHTSAALAVVALVGGGALAGGSYLLNRSARNPSPR
jgi:drug/metabolite transporter (DMT)-like permease